MWNLNCIIRTADRSPSGRRTDRSITVLRDLIDDFDLVDAGTVRNETSEIRFTHFQASSHAPLDRVYVSAPVAAMLRMYRVMSVYCLDHCFLSTTIGEKTSPKPFKCRLWKFKAKLHND